MNTRTGEPVTTTMATAGGAQPGHTARETATAYTDDGLEASSSGPSPAGPGTATTATAYHAAGEPLMVTDPNATPAPPPTPAHESGPRSQD